MKKDSTLTQRIAGHQKKWYGQWHTWAGLISGLILSVVSITGTILVYERELDAWLNPDLFTFEQTAQTRLTLPQALEVVKADHPQMHIEVIYEDQFRNNCIMVAFEEGELHKQAIVNPFTGKITGSRVYADSAMGIIRSLHRTLLVPEIGKYIVGIASLVMVILMITGLRLWIPKKWNMLKTRLTIKSGASVKRQVYDLHNTLGFYFSPVITILALTGAAITFNRFLIIGLFLVSFEPPKSIESILGQQSTYDANNPIPMKVEEVMAIANREIEGGAVKGITLPHDSLGTYEMNIIAPGYAETGDRSLVYYDQYTGERLMSTHHDLPHLGKVYLNWVTPLHYGTFGGQVTRILALITTLVIPVLFISGVYVWYGRWKKSKKKAMQKKQKKQLDHA
ncbi:PepSY-associated TM helix domain-containing protein [Algivirga pacifica]|uniref:PepSY-associated TM helix domain-containing protein n=1 Tax=Algivirga pacifica TaxID=1162670 RepID=A0ABP9D031_9BACT